MIKTWIIFNCSCLLGVLSPSLTLENAVNKADISEQPFQVSVTLAACSGHRDAFAHHTQQHRSCTRGNPGTAKNSCTTSALRSQVANSLTAHITSAGKGPSPCCWDRAGTIWQAKAAGTNQLQSPAENVAKDEDYDINLTRTACTRDKRSCLLESTLRRTEFMQLHNSDGQCHSEVSGQVTEYHITNCYHSMPCLRPKTCKAYEVVAVSLLTGAQTMHSRDLWKHWDTSVAAMQQNHRIAEWWGLGGPSVGHPAQPPAQAGSPRAGCTGLRPGGSWISPENSLHKCS